MVEFSSFTIPTRYRVYVTWVDHGTYVADARTTPALSNLSMETGRNFHITGFRIDGVGDPIKYNIVIPQEIQGSFKLPQIGDIITVDEQYRNIGDSPVYIYSVYNDLDNENFVSSQIPPWGSIPGDYGHIRSHSDHNFQFSEEANASFTQKFIKSVTGYRFRKFYGHVFNTKNRFLERGKFVVRGDNVFDVSKDDPLMSALEINTEEGVDIVPVKGNSLSLNQADYPNPLNVPIEREEDTRYVYSSPVPRFLSKQVEGDLYKGEGGEDVNEFTDERYKYVLKNKNYFSYQPIVDKKYFEYIDSIENDPQGNKPEPYERELPAAEEYQISLRGNNKLLIQDQYGDGDQLLITLKNQYDAGFTVVHNAESGQVRIRDHLGQGVLLEANPDAPRVISWTANRQVIEQGAVTGKGEFTYIRNGSVFGDADTTFGKQTGLNKSQVSNQEFLMVSNPSIIEELFDRLSDGMNDLVSRGAFAGIYIRNNTDPDLTSQEYSMFKNNDNLIIETRQVNEGEGGVVQEAISRQEFTEENITQSVNITHFAPGDSYLYSDVVSVSASGITRTHIEEKDGEDKITTVNVISGPNSATSTKTIELPLIGNIITITGDGSASSFEVDIVKDFLPAANFKISSEEVKSTHYVGGVENSIIEQTASAINIGSPLLDNITLTAKNIDFKDS
jgi:hypothetical protein